MPNNTGPHAGEPTRGGCHLVDSTSCGASPQSGHRISTRCFACGDFVCDPCSLVTTWPGFGRKRICHGCLRQDDQFDHRVYAHLWVLAGYTAEAGREAAEKHRAEQADLRRLRSR